MSEDVRMETKSDNLLTKAEVIKKTGLMDRTIDRWEADDLFPKRVKWPNGRVYWRETEVDKWVDNMTDIGNRDA